MQLASVSSAEPAACSLRMHQDHGGKVVDVAVVNCIGGNATRGALLMAAREMPALPLPAREDLLEPEVCLNVGRTIEIRGLDE